MTGKILQHENVTVWENEIESLRSILTKYANIPEEDILGFRAPKLHPGFNVQYEAMLKQGLVWDSSVATKPIKAPVWPYTLDYRIPHDCKIDSCPSKAYPGVWEIPLNSHYNEEVSGGQCTYLDQCVFTYQTSDNVFQWLKEDFWRYLTVRMQSRTCSILKQRLAKWTLFQTNKAPYTLPLHTNWFIHEHQREGLKKFVRWAKAMDGVYFVTVTDFLLWMTDPSAHSKPKENFRPLEPETNRRLSCSSPTTCEMGHIEKNGANTIRYMRTCEDCPNTYPWLQPLEVAEEDTN